MGARQAKPPLVIPPNFAINPSLLPGRTATERLAEYSRQIEAGCGSDMLLELRVLIASYLIREDVVLIDPRRLVDLRHESPFLKFSPDERTVTCTHPATLTPGGSGASISHPQLVIGRNQFKTSALHWRIRIDAIDAEPAPAAGSGPDAGCWIGVGVAHPRDVLKANGMYDLRALWEMRSTLDLMSFHNHNSLGGAGEARPASECCLQMQSAIIGFHRVGSTIDFWVDITEPLDSCVHCYIRYDDTSNSVSAAAAADAGSSLKWVKAACVDPQTDRLGFELFRDIDNLAEHVPCVVLNGRTAGVTVLTISDE